MTKIQYHIETINTAAQRFIDAWKRAEKGEHVDERHHSFENVETMQSVLSAKQTSQFSPASNWTKLLR